MSTGPWHYSLVKMQVSEIGHRWHSHKEGNLEVLIHKNVQVASSKTAVGMHNARGPREQPKLGRERWQQTCEADARQHMVASGSCCYMRLENRRSYPEVRRASLAATGHSEADHYD